MPRRAAAVDVSRRARPYTARCIRTLQTIALDETVETATRVLAVKVLCTHARRLSPSSRRGKWRQLSALGMSHRWEDLEAQIRAFATELAVYPEQILAEYIADLQGIPSDYAIIPIDLDVQETCAWLAQRAACGSVH